jgi:hypothetical protein
MPDHLVSAIKGELLSIGREGSTRTVQVEFWIRHGVPLEARVRNRESLHIVSLSS